MCLIRVNYITFFQPIDAVQYQLYNKQSLTVTWQYKALSYITTVSTDSFHQPCLSCLLCAMVFTGRQASYPHVKVCTSVLLLN